MQLLILAALLATLAHSDAAALADAAVQSASSTSQPWQLLWILLATIAAPFATACDGCWFMVRLRRSLLTSADPWPQAGQRYERLQLAAIWLWLGSALVVVYLLGWPAVVRDSWQLKDWLLVDDVLILAPVVSSLQLVWMTFYFVERRARHLRAATGQIAAAAPSSSLLAYLVWQCRHYLAMALVPAFVVLAIQDLIGYWAPGSSLKGAGEFAPWLVLPALVLIALALPLLLRRLWPTMELRDEALRAPLEAISHEMKTPLSRILIWQTQGRLANAAVAGLSRHCRYLFLTDALLVQLAPGEISAVVRHELGHLQRQHLPLRLLLLALPALAWFAWQPLVGNEIELLGPSPYALAISVAYLIYAALIVGTYSKWLEFDADLAAVFDTGGQVNADSARDLVHALAALQGPHRESRFAQLLHPPTAQRIGWIRKVLMQPAAGFAYRRRLDQLAAAIYGCVFVLVGVAAIASAF